MNRQNSEYSFKPLTPKRWSDFVELFGEHGAFGGCWCMWWRLEKADFENLKGEGNKNAMHGIVKKNEVPGILAYDGDKPIGWCSVAPREKFVRLERSKALKRIDNEPVWSVVCFFVRKDYRRRGVSEALLNTAVTFAKQNGAKIVEGYPTDSSNKPSPDPFVYMGLRSTFIQVGFQEVFVKGRRSIMRYLIK